MLFENVSKNSAEIDLNAEAIRWCERNSVDNTTPPKSLFLDPEFCQRALEGIHKDLGIEWSYGGYLEDRSFIWRGSYMEADKRFVHLGIDVNLPAGTPVHAGWPARVVHIDDDGDTEGGWGRRVILEPLSPNTDDTLLIFAHLGDVLCKENELLGAGARFATIGMPPTNGNWFPHLHVQCIKREHFEAIRDRLAETLDGYATAANLPETRSLFPDPHRFL